ncbi:MAG: MerR family transcriptional regulator [Bacteroidales bacterium]|nr:MerR family transcriptional regulator [Bacteroidales bacterium]
MEAHKLYYNIGEVAGMLGVAPSVLRFWEDEFEQIKPTKNKRGVRSYTQQDIEVLKRIRYLTRDCGYTLEGAREQLKLKPSESAKMELIDTLGELRRLLVELKKTL